MASSARLRRPAGKAVLLRVLVMGVYTVDQNERAVKTRFGARCACRAVRPRSTIPSRRLCGPRKNARYSYPQVRVIQPGGPYFKMPWEKIRKVSIATMTVNMALDPGRSQRQRRRHALEAVTKDQLNTGLTGQIRYRVSEANLYAFLFGIKRPFVHVMAYFVSVLRQRIANFEAKPEPPAPPARRGAVVLAGSEMTGISINDLRKNLRDLNEYMDNECKSTPARYGVIWTRR
jgi:regulator of protease activity HflC (stomatin/prohibitin superfamily)